MQKRLAKCPGWEKSAQALAAKHPYDGSGLVREPFPNFDNPVHLEIWEALRKKGKVGDGFGSVCTYNGDPKHGCYLITISHLLGQSRVSYFYVPSGRWVIDATDSTARSYYPGDTIATPENVRQFVATLSILLGYEAIAIEHADDIPHTRFQKENPLLSFMELLSSKGITVSPPQFLQKNENAEYSGYSECNLFVYMPCGGQVFRYEVRCRHGQIVDAKRYLIATGVGDCWYIM
jgi:hypothetical protein